VAGKKVALGLRETETARKKWLMWEAAQASCIRTLGVGGPGSKDTTSPKKKPTVALVIY
jgi:hypothetical protein